MIAKSELENAVNEVVDLYELDADGLAEDIIERLLQEFPDTIYDDSEDGLEDEEEE